MIQKKLFFGIGKKTKTFVEGYASLELALKYVKQ